MFLKMFLLCPPLRIKSVAGLFGDGLQLDILRDTDKLELKKSTVPI